MKSQNEPDPTQVVGNTPSDRRLLQVLWLVLLILAIGPLWSVHRDVWDGVTVDYGFARHDLSGIREMFTTSNWWLLYGLYKLMYWFSHTTTIPTWLLSKLIFTVSLVGLSIEAGQICRKVFLWNAADVQVTRLLILSFPVWYMLFGSNFLYTPFIWFGFWGMRWLHADAQPTWKTIAGYVLVIASYQVNSFFVMVFALEAVYWLYRDPAQRWPWQRSAALALSAVCTYLSLRFIIPPSGNYRGYNNLINPFSTSGLFAWARASLMYATWIPLLLAAPLMAWLLTRMRGQQPVLPARAGRQTIALVLLLLGACTAYIAVGKGPPLFVVNIPLDWLRANQHLGVSVDHWLYLADDGWSARNAFLLSVPAVMSIVWLLRGATSVSDASIARRSWWLGIACIVLCNGFFMVHGYATKLGRFAKEQSIIEGMRALAPPPKGRLDIVLPAGTPWGISTYEANYWTWKAWGTTAWATAAYPADLANVEPILKDREAAIVVATTTTLFFPLTDYLPTSCRSVWAITPQLQLDAVDWLGYSLLGRPIAPATIEVKTQQC